MKPVTEIDFADPTEGIPALLAIVMMPFAYSIAEGIVYGTRLRDPQDRYRQGEPGAHRYLGAVYYLCVAALLPAHMTNEEILSHVDHTLLRATATWAEIEVLSTEALNYNTASVCVPPCYVKRIHEVHPSLVICTVIGFPLGYSVTVAKYLEAESAIGRRI